jgi:hypothetical protein
MLSMLSFFFVEMLKMKKNAKFSYKIEIKCLFMGHLIFKRHKFD